MKWFNKKLIAVVVLLTLLLGIIYINNLKNKKVVLDKVETKINNANKSMFAIYVSGDNGYEEYNGEDGLWPSGDYIFNDEKSGCVNDNGKEIANVLEFDNEKHTANIKTKQVSYCYLYFDNAIFNGTGEKLIKYHPAGLKDNLYGKIKLIKNLAISEEDEDYPNKFYVWYTNMYTDITWPNSNIFKRLNGQSGGQTPYFSGDTNLFIDSTTSNVNYLKTTGDTTWYDKIEKNHSWWYGDIYSIDENSTTVNDIYRIETGQLAVKQASDEDATVWPSNQKVTAPIGLMYLSDWLYSYSKNGEESLLEFNNNIDSWLKISNSEEPEDPSIGPFHDLTMTRKGGMIEGPDPVDPEDPEDPTVPNSMSLSNMTALNDSEISGRYYGYGIYLEGRLTAIFLNNVCYIRPVFYLMNDVQIKGKGTLEEPFIVEK